MEDKKDQNVSNENKISNQNNNIDQNSNLIKIEIINNLKDFTGDDQDSIKEMIANFLSEYPVLKNELLLKLKQETITDLGKIIHKMKSPLKMFALNNLICLLQKLNIFEEANKFDNNNDDELKKLKHSNFSIEDWIQEFNKESLSTLNIINEIFIQ